MFGASTETSNGGRNDVLDHQYLLVTGYTCVLLGGLRSSGGGLGRETVDAWELRTQCPCGTLLGFLGSGYQTREMMLVDAFEFT